MLLPIIGFAVLTFCAVGAEQRQNKTRGPNSTVQLILSMMANGSESPANSTLLQNKTASHKDLKEILDKWRVFIEAAKPSVPVSQRMIPVKQTRWNDNNNNDASDAEHMHFNEYSSWNGLYSRKDSPGMEKKPRATIAAPSSSKVRPKKTTTTTTTTSTTTETTTTEPPESSDESTPDSESTVGDADDTNQDEEPSADDGEQKTEKTEKPIY